MFDVPDSAHRSDIPGPDRARLNEVVIITENSTMADNCAILGGVYERGILFGIVFIGFSSLL